MICEHDGHRYLIMKTKKALRSQRTSEGLIKYAFLKQSERQDLNLRPLLPQSSALPSCATPRCDALQAYHKTPKGLNRILIS
jgi:hypothetical protein